MRAWAAAGYLAAAWLAFLPGFYDGNALKWALLYFPAVALAARFALDPPKLLRIDAASATALALLGWAAFSLLWSQDWRNGLIGVFNGAACLALFWWARNRPEVLPKAAALGIAAAAVIQQGVGYHGGFGNPNFLAEFLLMAAPFVCLHRFGWALAGFAAALLLFRVDALMGAALNGGLVWASLEYRLDLLMAAILMWADAPVWGQGLGSYDLLYPLYGEGHVLSDPGLSAGAAHNDLLQLHAELGLVGAGLAGLLAWYALRRLWGELTPLDRACLASLAIGAVLALGEFPLQNPATASLAAMSLGVLTRGVRTFPVQVPALRLMFPAASVALLAYGISATVAQMTFALVDLKNQPALDAYVFTRTAYRSNPLDPMLRHHLYLTAVGARMDADTIDRAEAVAATASPHHTRYLILKAARSAGDPVVAQAFLAELQRRPLSGPVLDPLKRHLELHR
ncbi:MAG: O-antigen ligase family protein [Novosphingobium sp.]|nr:O-antigen ligase family protein [Novosphingobium sp.]